MNLAELLAKLTGIDAKLDAIMSDDELTEAQEADIAKLNKERDSVKKAVAREKDRIAREDERNSIQVAAEARRVQDEKDARRVTPGTNRITNTEPTRQHNSRQDDQGFTTASFMEATNEEVSLRFGETKDAIIRRSRHETNKRNWSQLRDAGYKPCGRGGEFSSFSEFVREGMESHATERFRNRMNKQYSAVVGMSEGVASEGGYLVMPEFAGGIIDRIYNNPLWGRTDNYAVAGNNMTFLANAETSRANGSRHGGMRGYWLAEGATATASKPSFREVTLKLVKVGVLVYLTEEAMADTGNFLQSHVTQKAGEEFNFMIGDSVLNGTGVGQPLGVANAPSLISVAKETGQTAATIQTENIDKIYSRFYAPNIGSSYWYHNQDIRPQLEEMTLGVGTGGVPTFLPPGGLSVAPYGMLKGRPLEPTEFNATLGTQTDLILADLGGILSISKGGVNQAVSMHVQFLTQQTALLFTLRLNATPWDSSAITPYKGSNTQSLFVTLDTRA